MMRWTVFENLSDSNLGRGGSFSLHHRRIDVVPENGDVRVDLPIGLYWHVVAELHVIAFEIRVEGFEVGRFAFLNDFSIDRRWFSVL